MLYQRQNPHGGDLYSQPIRLDFSANTNPFGTPDSVKQAVIDCLDQLHQYPDPYCRELVAAIAEYEQVPSNQILCGNGAADLIFAFCQAVKPKCALELAPTFSEYSAALESVGCQVERYPLNEEQAFCLDERFLETLQGKKWSCIFLCNPNNPTGQTIPNALLEEIAALCRKKKILLFLDECFQDLCDDEAQYSLKQRLNENPYVFILKAFTKSYGMAALRLGYGLCGNEALLNSMSHAVQSWNLSLPAQKAGVAALKEREFLRHSKTVIRQEKEWLQKELSALQLKVLPSKANYLFFRGPKQLKQQLLLQGIQIRDCSNYPGLEEGWYRIAIKKQEENQALITAMKQVMERSGGEWQNVL